MAWPVRLLGGACGSGRSLVVVVSVAVSRDSVSHDYNFFDSFLCFLCFLCFFVFFVSGVVVVVVDFVVAVVVVVVVDIVVVGFGIVGCGFFFEFS